MNLLLLAPHELAADGTATVGGERLAHLRDIQSFRPGDRLRVGVLGGRLGQGEILSLGDAAATLAVSLDADPPPENPVTLVIALPRPKMLKRILVDATSLGVKRIHFINAWRVEKSFWGSPALAADALAAKCRLGLEQAIDTMPPAVTLHDRFRPFAEDVLPALAAGTTALLAHPAAAQECPRGVAGPVTLVIGPEGGFTDYEARALSAAGCSAVTLGPRILRVETAVSALLGRLR